MGKTSQRLAGGKSGRGQSASSFKVCPWTANLTRCPQLHRNHRLYAGEADYLLNVIHKLGDKLERVMLFGHNPELTELTHRLSSKITHMPTCAVAEFTFVAKSWSNIGKAKPAKVALDYPKKS